MSVPFAALAFPFLLAASPSTEPTPCTVPIVCPAPAPAPEGSAPPPEQPPPPPPATEQPAPAPVVDEAAAARLLALVNESRGREGLPALAEHGRAAEAARSHSHAMAERGDIFHNDAYFTGAMRERLGARALGENVAVNQSVDDAHRRLLASAGHRANILDRRFSAVGIAVVRTGDGSLWITEDFVQPRTPAARPGAPPTGTPRPARPTGAPATTAPPPPAPPAPLAAPAPTTSAQPTAPTTAPTVAPAAPEPAATDGGSRVGLAAAVPLPLLAWCGTRLARIARRRRRAAP